MVTKYCLRKRVEIGGLTREEIPGKLTEKEISLNPYAEQLLNHDLFKVSKKREKVNVKSLTLYDLSLKKGAFLEEIFFRALKLGLELCSLEIAVFLRLEYLDQQPGPYLTVASPVFKEELAFPKGMYLRVYDDKIWLRGYIASNDYLWPPESEFVFVEG